MLAEHTFLQDLGDIKPTLGELFSQEEEKKIRERSALPLWSYQHQTAF